MAYRILLSKLLGELRWTQADLARATGIRPALINEIFWDIQVGRITVDQIDLICDALGCTPGDLMEWEPNAVSRTKTRRGNVKRKKPPQE